MLQRCLFLILMLESFLVDTAVDRTHRERDVVIVSSCKELRQALITDDTKTHIKLRQNLNCSAIEWGTPVSVIGDRVVEGLRLEDQLLSIHLDLSSIKHGIVLSEQQSLSFRSLVIHTDQEGSSTTESMLSSVLLQGTDSVVYISGSVIMSHSCRKYQNRVLYFSSSQLNDATTVEEQSRVLSGTFKNLHVCQCRLCCFTGQDTPVVYGLSENSKSEEDSCSQNERNVQTTSMASSKTGGRNQRRRVISLTLVCVFSVLFVILGLILWRRLLRETLNDEDTSEAKKEENRLSEEKTPISQTEEGGGPPYIIKFGDISIDTSQELGTGGFGVVYEGTYKVRKYPFFLH